MATVEEVKLNSHNLRGTLKEALASDATGFSEADKHMLKFHGMYQEMNRDKKGPDRVPIILVRCKLPGGLLTPQQYLALESLADSFGNGTMRLTTRQGIQIHYVLKTNVKEVIRRINASGVTTWASSGDSCRNTVATAMPFTAPVYAEARELARELAREMAPRKWAYVDVWFDDKPLALNETLPPEDGPDPLYGPAYLPRKFKIGIAVPPHNDIDVYTQDLAFVPHFPSGTVEGYTVLAGGGMGMDHGRTATHPALAQPLMYVKKAQVIEAAKAVIMATRDNGNRIDRKQARLKYLIRERGLAWFRAEVNKHLSTPGEDPKPFTFANNSDLHGWHPQGDGAFFYTLRVENGRVQDTEIAPFRTGIHALVETFQRPLVVSPNHSLIFCGIGAAQRPAFEAMLRKYNLDSPVETLARRDSLVCVALPTCNLALAESERIFTKFMLQIEGIVKGLSLSSEALTFRMTGCANGCVRPYVADFAFVGRGPGKYAFFAGGSPLGNRMGSLIEQNVPLEALPGKVKAILEEFVAKRQGRETFSDCWLRLHPEQATMRPEQFHQPQTGS